jgi:nucleoid-associated protein YgaU
MAEEMWKRRAEEQKSAAAEPKYKAEHTVESGETLSSISMKYYDSADRDDWMAIYDANKEVIGDNPNLIKPDQVLKIPER